MNHKSCPFCNSKKISFFLTTYDIENNTWNLYYCFSCNFYFLDPLPDEKVLEKAYSTEYYGKGEKKFTYPLIENVINYFRQSRARLIHKFLKYNHNAHILDIGCGNGQFLNYLYKKGYKNLYGIELPGKSAERASKFSFIKLHTGTIFSQKFEDNTFDAITMFHVFEHTTNPVEAILLISKWLKPYGYFIVSFPNICSRQARWFKGKWLHLDPPRHLNFICPEQLIKKMEMYNLKIVKKQYFSIEQNPFGYLQSLLNVISSKRELLFESFKGNKEYLKNVSFFELLAHRMLFYFLMPVFVIFDIIDSLTSQSGTVLLVFKKE